MLTIRWMYFEKNRNSKRWERISFLARANGSILQIQHSYWQVHGHGDSSSRKASSRNILEPTHDNPDPALDWWILLDPSSNQKKGAARLSCERICNHHLGWSPDCIHPEADQTVLQSSVDRSQSSENQIRNEPLPANFEEPHSQEREEATSRRIDQESPIRANRGWSASHPQILKNALRF